MSAQQSGESVNHRAAVLFEQLLGDFRAALKTEGIPCPLELGIPIPLFKKMCSLVSFQESRMNQITGRAFVLRNPDGTALTVRPVRQYCWEKMPWDEVKKKETAN